MSLISFSVSITPEKLMYFVRDRIKWLMLKCNLIFILPTKPVSLSCVTGMVSMFHCAGPLVI